MLRIGNWDSCSDNGHFASLRRDFRCHVLGTYGRGVGYIIDGQGSSIASKGGCNTYAYAISTARTSDDGDLPAKEMVLATMMSDELNKLA